MRADKPFRHEEIRQRAARARANYSADHFELNASSDYGLEPTNAASINRDPRTDPQPGDVLAIGDDVREVITAIGSHVEYGFPGKAATRWLDSIRWMLWARNADVQKVAP
jgi:hypothetical protein